MKGVIGLGADFFERLTDPVYGVEVNEAYAARLTDLTRRDERMWTQLLANDLAPSDVDLLPAQTWLWYLDWLGDNGGLPPDDFVTALYEDVGDPVFRLRIVEAVIRHPEVATQLTERRLPGDGGLAGLPSSWVRMRLLGLVRGSQADQEFEDREEQFHEAFELATSLLQIGSQPALAVLGALLSHRWPGRGWLADQVDHLLSATLEGEDLNNWRRRLGLRPPPRG